MKAFAQRLGVRLASAAMQALCILLIARQAGPAHFGVFVIGIAVGAVVGAIVGFGATTRAIRVLREDDPAAMAGSLTILRVLSAFATALVVVGVLLALGSKVGASLAVAVIAASDHFCDFEQACRAGLLQHGRSALVILVQRLFPMLLVAVAYVRDLDTISAYAWGAVAALAIIAPGAWGRGLMSPRHATRGAFAYWTGAVAQVTQQLDNMLVRAVVGPVAVGIYGAGNRLVSPLGLITNSAVVALSPGLGQVPDPAERHRRFMRFAKTAAVLGLLVGLLAPVVAYVVGSVLGQEYAQARPIIMTITIASGVGAVAQVLQSYLYMEGRVREVARANMASVGLGLVALVVAGWWGGTAWLGCGVLANYTLLASLLIWRVRSASDTGCGHSAV